VLRGPRSKRAGAQHQYAPEDDDISVYNTGEGKANVLLEPVARVRKRFLRRLLCQAAQAAVRTKDSHLQARFKRLVVRLGYVKAVWAVAHRICKIIWNILHRGARFTEFSDVRNPKAVQRAINHHLKALRRLGYSIPPSPHQAVAAGE
jgi:hypothetical protein